MVIRLSPKDHLSLYFHIPFCKKKCDYCHFYVVPDKEQYKKLLLEGLYLEWQRWAQKCASHKLISIYFGGGTPALFGPDRIALIIEWIKEIFPFEDCPPEITLEANPEDITLPMMQAYKAAGVNRISIGVQSLNNSELLLLTRGHSANKSIEAIYNTYKAGITNISIDLMYDLPSQTIESWNQTLDQLKPLPIAHLSLYNLTIEPHTVFYKYRNQLAKNIPNEEMSLVMYQTAVKTLNALGLVQYEVSAFAKNSLISSHNSGYWTARPFIGLGPSGYSFWEGERFKNISNIHKYVQLLKDGHSPIDHYDTLNSADRRKELFVIALRLRDGVDYQLFEKLHGSLDKITKETLARLVSNQLIACEENSTYTLTDQGILLYDYVASELI